MIRITVGTNNPRLEELQFLLAKMGQRAGTLPRTAAALNAGAELIQDTWQKYATGETPMPGLKPSGSYAKSIRTKPLGEFEHEIFSEAKIAERIENGTEELDMKKTHPYGPRSRVSKKGIPYLIVPFQWGTKEGTKRVGAKNIIPKQLLNMMLSKKFKKSTVKSDSQSPNAPRSPNARGEMVARNTYTWGDRTRGSDFSGTIEQKRFTNGMVRFEQGTAADSPQGKRYGGYFTFRVISANSPANSWIKPATPALHVAEIVAKETRKDVEAMVDAAIKEDFSV
jgi:hypothetical protein